MKAKQNSQSFAKLTNELATPPTKLYSPFNFCTSPRSQRQLDGSFTIQHISDEQCIDKQLQIKTIESNKNASGNTKDRIANKHKRHLINQFAIDSPTGRFRETVRDVEKFQQCIEEISEAIYKTRDHCHSEDQSKANERSSNLLDCSANFVDFKQSPLKATTTTTTSTTKSDELVEFY